MGGLSEHCGRTGVRDALVLGGLLSVPPLSILHDLQSQIPWVQAWYDRVHARPAVAAARAHMEIDEGVHCKAVGGPEGTGRCAAMRRHELGTSACVASGVPWLECQILGDMCLEFPSVSIFNGAVLHPHSFTHYALSLGPSS